MSKEVLEKILKAEEEAKVIIIKAEAAAEKEFADAEDKISKDSIAFYEKLKAEKNEKMRRIDMQMNINTEAAKNKAEKVYEYRRDRYNKYFDAAVDAAVYTVLKRGGISVGNKDT